MLPLNIIIFLPCVVMKIFSSARFKIILHVFLGLLLGGCIAMAYLSSSVTFRQYLQHRVQEQFEHDYGSRLRCNLDAIDWMNCSMTFSGVQISSTQAEVKKQTSQQEDAECSWSILAETLKVKGSWISILLHGCLSVSLSFEHVIMLEVFDQAPVGLAEFFKKMFAPVVTTPVVYDLISISDGLLYLKRLSDGLNAQIPYSSHMRMQSDGARMQLYLHDGSVAFYDATLIQDIGGSIICDLPYVDVVSHMSGQVQLNYLFAKSDRKIPGFLAGKIEHGVGEFAMKTEDGSIAIDPIKINCSDTACWCSVMVAATSEILRYFDLPDQIADVAGSVGLELNCDLYDLLQTLQASIVLNQVTYKSKQIIPGGKILVTQHHKQGFSGVLSMHDQDMFEVSVNVDGEKKSLTARNLVDLQIPLHKMYKILKDSFQISMIYDEVGDISGTYLVDIYDPVLEQSYHVVGQAAIHHGYLKIWGTANDLTYEGAAQLFPDYVFQYFWVKRADSLLIDCSSDEQDGSYVTGSVDFSVIRSIVPESWVMSFAQEGSFVFKGKLKDGVCSATVQTHYAHIRVPYIYNVIQNITATCQLNINERQLIFKDIDVECYEGKISCSHANLCFDKNFNWYFAHAPLMLHDVMLSWNKGVYGLVTGRILLHKNGQQDPLHVDGQLMVQRSELKENIFSAQFQDIVSGMFADVVADDQTMQPHIDISLFTKDPLQITTSFLAAKALVDVRLKGLLYKTELSGVIRLLSGSLLFPYKPLEIVEGKLMFIPEQPFDPVIEFVAKGKLKRFHIALKAWGSALDPHFSFEATPYLSEDQIISLLLLGVEDQSLSLMVPAFLTQKLKDIMFGPALSSPKLKSIFDRLLHSLKYVRFIPQFTNQTGRGGVRGIFEIDASEHLQGKIDTNFAQLEDTKFDIDYSVTDDVTLRLQKDGPSTYGGQVEFRWKFS